MTLDPPWLDEAIELFDHEKDDNLYNALRNALLFAACQPRPITEAEVEAAALVMVDAATITVQTDTNDVTFWRNRARAALEAAEKARADRGV